MNVISRASDKTPNVRTRALVCLATAAEVARQAGHEALLSAVDHAALEAVMATPGSIVGVDGSTEASALQLVRHRTADARGGVRRAAIAALCAFMQLPAYVFDAKDVKVSMLYIYIYIYISRKHSVGINKKKAQLKRKAL